MISNRITKIESVDLHLVEVLAAFTDITNASNLLDTLVVQFTKFGLKQSLIDCCIYGRLGSGLKNKSKGLTTGKRTRAQF